MRRQECGSNAMVTVQMTVEEYLEMKSRQEVKETQTKPKNLVYGLDGIKTLFGAERKSSKFYRFFCQKRSGIMTFFRP